jgi:hypothetical protein
MEQVVPLLDLTGDGLVFQKEDDSRFEHWRQVFFGLPNPSPEGAEINTAIKS